MKQIKKLGLVVVTLLLSATMAFAAKPFCFYRQEVSHKNCLTFTFWLREEPLPEQEARLRAPAIRQDKLLSVHCWMQSPKSKISPM